MVIKVIGERYLEKTKICIYIYVCLIPNLFYESNLSLCVYTVQGMLLRYSNKPLIWPCFLFFFTFYEIVYMEIIKLYYFHSQYTNYNIKFDRNTNYYKQKKVIKTLTYSKLIIREAWPTYVGYPLLKTGLELKNILLVL